MQFSISKLFRHQSDLVALGHKMSTIKIKNPITMVLEPAMLIIRFTLSSAERRHWEAWFYRLRWQLIVSTVIFERQNLRKIDHFMVTLWCDQAKSVWSRTYSIFSFLLNLQSYILQKSPLKLNNQFKIYQQLKSFQNIRKQKEILPLFGCILKSIIISDFRLTLLDHITHLFGCYKTMRVI